MTVKETIAKADAFAAAGDVSAALCILRGAADRATHSKKWAQIWSAYYRIADARIADMVRQ
jgi:hypothetical protein